MSLLKDFKSFVVRGNLLDLAVGFTVGAAFTSVVKSAVADLIMPPVGILLGGANFSKRFIVLKHGKGGDTHFQTVAQANEAGAVTLNYGNFIDASLALLVVGIVMFLVVRSIKRMEDRWAEEAGGVTKVEAEPDNKKCPFCLVTIAFQAVRCPQCTSELEGFRARRDMPGVALNEVGAAADEP